MQDIRLRHVRRQVLAWAREGSDLMARIVGTRDQMDAVRKEMDSIQPEEVP